MLVKMFTIFVGNVILGSMKFGTILLVIYIVCVVSWILFVSLQKKVKDKQGIVFFLISIPFAPICWLVGLGMAISARCNKDRPRPLPKNLLGKLKKDVVLFNHRTMSIAEVNRITGKEYTLEQIYGKKYVASLTDEDRREFDNGASELRVDDHVRKDEADYPAIERFAKARMEGRLKSVRDLFDPDVTLVVYEQKTLHGIDSVLAFWQDRYDSSITRRVKFDYRIVPCMLYNGTAIEEAPERFARMLITFRFRNGKIALMGLSPEFLNPDYPYYGGFKEVPYTEEYFSRYFTSDLMPEANRITCPVCGELSENLEWHDFDHNDYHPFNGYRGQVSVCPHCHCTVEIRPSESYERSEEEQEAHPKRFFEKAEPFVAPHMYYAGFEYATPLEGTAYLDNLDNEILIEPNEILKQYLHGEEAEPMTARQCAAEFHHILFGTLKEKDRKCFDAILDCYRKAYEDGLIEAGNNLAIMYINWADRQDEGEALMKECAEKGCENAIGNYFNILWGTHQDYEAATRFALSAPKPTIPVLWNLAVMYLLGPEIKGNPLPTDKDKSKQCLRQILDGAAPRFDDLSNRFEQAQALLPRVDDINELTMSGWNFIGSCIKGIIHGIDNNYYEVQSTLKGHLPHIHVPDGMSIGLSVASEEHNDHGDITRFVLLHGEEVVCAGDEELLPHLIVEKSVEGAWEAYLFSLSRHLLPTYWHGGYNAREIIFGKEDLKQIPSQVGRAFDVIINGHELSPSVHMEGNVAHVECCYWSEWGGLYREKVDITFDGDRIVDFKTAEAENIYRYDCGIMF